MTATLKASADGTQAIIQVNGVDKVTIGSQGIGQGAPAGFRNKIINGDMVVWQRGTSFTLTSGATAYTADRFYVNTSGGAGTVSRVAGTGGFRFAMRITGASGISSAFFGQKIESLNMGDLAGGNVTGQIRLSASSNRTITWYARYPTADDNYAGATAITSGTINVTTTPTTFTFSFAVPGAATTGLEIYFDIGALGAGATIDVTGYQLEPGSIATPFEHRPYGTELALCQRYYETGRSAYGARNPGDIALGTAYFKVTKRVAPANTFTTNVGGATTQVYSTVDSVAWYAVPTTSMADINFFSSAEL